MSIESTIILQSIGDQSPDLAIFTFSDKFKGAGYYKKQNGDHTVQFDLNQFEGTIKLQGTLEMYPGDNDWIDIIYTNGSTIEAADSTPITISSMRNFVGNWLWIRVGYILEQGDIILVRYNI
jgi:hypothetical protein